MRPNTKIKAKNIRNITLAALAGLILGFVFFHHHDKGNVTGDANEEMHEKAATVWTCSMHPQIRLDHPGKCPICGMDLIPVGQLDKREASFSESIPMSTEAIKLAEISTTRVKMASPQKDIRLLGKVKPDETSVSELTARFSGRIEKLFVNFTGQEVKKGERMAVIYSPELVSAQRELIEAYKTRESSPELYQAARNNLRVGNVTGEQIREIEQRGEPENDFNILSPVTGTVTMRHVAVGDYVKEGSVLFKVIDLSHVWIMFEAYESDLPWLRLNDPVTFTVNSLPGKEFRGRISFIDPVMDPKTRIANVRVALGNPKEELKPEMFASGTVHSSIAATGKQLLIPKSALLWTGKRSIVYVKIPGAPEPLFEYREIVTGPETEAYYVVKQGLKEGEEIAVNGVFSIDAAAQLSGMKSMMNPESGETSKENENQSMIIPQKTVNNKEGASPAILKNEQGGEINLDFKKQLTAVYNSYLEMKDAFIKSDPELVHTNAMSVSAAMKNVQMELLEGEQHMSWMKDLNNLELGILGIIKSDDIETQRKSFAGFSSALYHAIKSFGLYKEKTYYQYCPMAFDNKGAYWLSERSEIRNPYFGDEMIDCGENKDSLK